MGVTLPDPVVRRNGSTPPFSPLLLPLARELVSFGYTALRIRTTSSGPEFALATSMEIAMKLERILVPVDFSDCSRAALAHATMLQQVTHAHLHVLHTHDLPIAAPAHAMLLAGELSASSVEHAQRFTALRLEDFLTKLSIKAGDTVRASVELGPAASTIVTVASQEKCDLIVMGTHGRTGLSRALLGSTAEAVLHSAPCAVLTVKAPSSDAKTNHPGAEIAPSST